jgi:dihydrofolate reductase
MSRIRYYVAASADGYIADRDNDLGWLMAFGFEQFQAHYDAFMADVGALVMGAATYEFILREESGWSYAQRPTWVFTHRRQPRIDGADLRFVQGDVAAEHPRIVESAGGKDVWLVGGGAVAAQFADAGLVDELLVTYLPVVLGGGFPVLPVARQLGLRLEGTTPFPDGAVEFAYAIDRTPRGAAG